MPKLIGEVLTYTREQGFDVRIAYGTSGNANGLTEYIGYAVPGTADSTAAWRIVKLAYNATGQQTHQRHAGQTDTYDKVWNDRTTYNYVDI